MTVSRRRFLGGTAAGAAATLVSTIKGGYLSKAEVDGRFELNVLQHGVTGDGITNDRDAIQRVVVTYGGMRPIYFPAGRYRIGTAGLSGPNRIDLPSGTQLLFGDGAVVEVNQVDDQSGACVFHAAGTDGSKVRLTADAANGSERVILPNGYGNSFAPGDVVGFESFGKAGNFDAGKHFAREFHSVASVSSDTLLLDGPLEYHYAVAESAVFWRVNVVEDIAIEGASFESGPGVKLGDDGSYALRLSKIRNVRLANIRLKDMTGGLLLVDCFGGQIIDCSIDRLPRKHDAYGYGVTIAGASAQITINNLRGSDTRHLFTTISDERNGSEFWGGPMGIQVIDGLGYGSPDGLSIWDTHEFGRHIEFNNCWALGGGPSVSGFQIRAQDVSMNSCGALDNGLRAVVLTKNSERVTIQGGDFGFAGEQGISVAGDGHQIHDVRVHDCASGGISFAPSTNLRVRSSLLVDNAYGMMDGGVDGSLDARISETTIPRSEKQQVSILDLSPTAVAEDLLCVGYESAGGLWNSVTSDWGAERGATYSINTGNNWISESSPTFKRP